MVQRAAVDAWRQQFEESAECSFIGGYARELPQDRPELFAQLGYSLGADTVFNTASQFGILVARPNTAVYSLTKFGVNAFSEGIRQELIGKRVRVGIVGPGTVETEITDHLPAEAADDRAALEQGLPVGAVDAAA